MSTSKTERVRVPTVHKLGRLLDAFTPEHPRWTLTALSRELGWDMATTHRLVKALVDIDMLGLDDDGRYEIGSVPLRLAAVSTSADSSWNELLHLIRDIADRTALTTQLGVLDGRHVAIVASEEGRSDINAAARTGERLPIHATAVGKAILSQLPDDEIAALLEPGLEAFTPDTITDPAVLLREVAAGRAEGIWRVRSELSPGLDAAATPIPRKWFGSRPAAITCAGLPRELVPERWELAEATLRTQFGADDTRPSPAREVGNG